MLEKILDVSYYYNELIRSIPIDKRSDILKELDKRSIVRKTESLKKKLAKLENIDLNLEPSELKTLFLAALRGVKLSHISVEQLATLHILNSAIQTLYTDPRVYIIHEYVGMKNEFVGTCNILVPLGLKGLPTSVRRFSYEEIILPNGDIHVFNSNLVETIQKSLIRRFFNFTDAEWEQFSNEMQKAKKSERYYHVLNVPEVGCFSGIIYNLQKILKCMQILEWVVNSNRGLIIEKIMVIPSFTMFQLALNAKAHTLQRNPVQLIPTYGYIDAEHYAELKRTGKIALTLYLQDVGDFRTMIDGHQQETAFAGALHDVYHAMREMAMSENIAKARMRLASIAKKNPFNKKNSSKKEVSEILIDGELIYSYSPKIDTMFENRPSQKQIFGQIFYTEYLQFNLDPRLKCAFVEDMVKNKSIWQEQFGLNKNDLLIEDQITYDEINLNYSAIQASLEAELFTEALLGDFNTVKSMLTRLDSPNLARLLPIATKHGYPDFINSLLSEKTIRDYYVAQIIKNPTLMNDAFKKNYIFFNALRKYRTEIWGYLQKYSTYNFSLDQYNNLLNEILDWRQESNTILLRHPLYRLFEQPRRMPGLFGLPTTILDELRSHLDKLSPLRLKQTH